MIHPVHSLRRPLNFLFLTLLLLMLAPVWGTRYFPSVDGPSHLYNAHVLLHYDDPDRAIYRTYYAINRSPEPNWLTTLILAGLMAAMPPLIAEKLLLSLYVLLLPLAFRYALGAFGRRPRAMAVLIFPFVYNWMLYMGFYNYVFSLALYLLTVGYGLRHRAAFGGRQASRLTLLAIVLYFCHIVSFVQAALALVTGWLIAPLAARQSRLAPARWVWLALAFIPATALAAWFLFQTGLTGQNLAQRQLLYFHALKITHLLDLYYALLVFRDVEMIWTIGLAAALLALSGGLLARKARRRRWSPVDWLLVLAAIYTAIYLVAPAELSRGYFLYPRISIFPWLALLIWLAAQPLTRRLRGVAALASVAATLGLMFLHLGDAARWNRSIDEMVALGPQIQTGQTLWSHVLFDSTPPVRRADQQRRVKPEMHIAGYLAIDRGLVNLSDFEGDTGYCPLIYRPEVNPFRRIGPHYGVPRRYLLREYQDAGPGRVDYVLVCRIDEPAIFSDQQLMLLQQIETGFERVAISKPGGYFALYRAKENAE